MSAQQIVVDSGLIVKPFGVGRRHDLDEILVAFPVLDEQHQVSLILVVSGFFIEARPRRRVDFAADDGFNAGFLRFLVEVDDAEHHTVIRDRQRLHPQLFCLFDDPVDPGGAVKQTVFGMQM